MEDQVDKAIQKEEEGAMEDAASENIDQLREDFGKPADDNEHEIAMRAAQSDRSVASSTPKSSDGVQKEPPEMNIQLQR